MINSIFHSSSIDVSSLLTFTGSELEPTLQLVSDYYNCTLPSQNASPAISCPITADLTEDDTEMCASPSVPSEPTLRQQLMADWIGTPSEQVLKCADDINYSKLVTSHCCQRQCLMHFDVDFLRACRIRYLRMTQQESRKWLSNMMENQPTHGKQYFVTNEVAHLPLFTSLSARPFLSLVCISEGLPYSIHVGLGHLRKQDGCLLQ